MDEVISRKVVTSGPGLPTLRKWLADVGGTWLEVDDATAGASLVVMTRRMLETTGEDGPTTHVTGCSTRAPADWFFAARCTGRAGFCSLVARWADDFVVVCRTRREAQAARALPSTAFSL